MISSGGILMPRFTTSYPLLPRMISTRFLPMSWTSPLTVARTILPRAAVSAFSMNCWRWFTDAFIASADCRTSAFGHPRHQRSVDDVERRRSFFQLQVEVGNQAVLGALNDVVGQPLIEWQV